MARETPGARRRASARTSSIVGWSSCASTASRIARRCTVSGSPSARQRATNS
ncbi:MAG: hypothetical protein MUF27_12900 [Acidobacteria bacterium]|nr:hypothetical protein [Acidobacteriota bacterium]